MACSSSPRTSSKCTTFRRVANLFGVARRAPCDAWPALFRLGRSLRTAGPAASHGTGGYPVEPTDIHPSRAPPRMHPRPRHADRQGVPHLFARQGTQCRRHRDRPHRPRHQPRAAAGRAVGLHHHQHQLAAEARRADDGRHHPDVEQGPGGHRHAVHAVGRHGAGDDRRRAGAAERRGAGRHRLRPDGEQGRAGRLWRLHLQCRHEVRRAGLRHAGIHEGAACRRPARAPLQHPLPHLQRLRRQHGRRAGRL